MINMRFPCLISNIIRSVSKLMKLITASQLLNLLLLIAHLEHMIILILKILGKSLAICSLVKSDDDHSHGDHHMMPSDHDHHHHGENRPNPASLVPVPVYFFAETVKNQLPVMPYKSFLEKNKLMEKEGCVCIVCLNRIELSHEVREPFSCNHVFHRECLDVWVDQGQGTCPLCRSKLLPTKNHDNHDHQGGDPWRRERMIYLFGEDSLFGDDQ